MSKTLIAKMNIKKSAKDVYEAFANPEKIKNFWFSGSSRYWETGQTVTLSNQEYGAEFDVQIIEALPYSKIIFEWGAADALRRNTLSFAENFGSTLVTVTEAGFDEVHIDEMLKNQSGWVFMLTCLKAYLENGVTNLRNGLVI